MAETDSVKQKKLEVASSSLHGEGGGRGRLVFLRKFNKTLSKLDTQKIREDAVNELLELAKAAHRKAKPKKGRSVTEALNWARVTAYLYQTINSITREYDEKEIKTAIAELKEVVKSALGTGDRADQEGRREDKSEEEKSKDSP